MCQFKRVCAQFITGSWPLQTQQVLTQSACTPSKVNPAIFTLVLPRAQMSVTLMVTTLMQRLRFRPLPRPDAPAFPLQVAYDITMNFNPTNGLRMEVMPRDDAAEGRTQDF